MATFMGDMVVKVGEFQTPEGQTKSRYLKIGSWFQDDQGRISCKILAMPLVPDAQTGIGVWVSLMHKQEGDQGKPQRRQGNRGRPAQQQQRQGQGQQQQRQGNQGTGYDEVPF